MKREAHVRPQRAIPDNCPATELPSPVQDLAELLADIAAQQFRAKQSKKMDGLSDDPLHRDLHTLFE